MLAFPRVRFAGLVLITILLGLLLQRARGEFPPRLADVTGDALWAAMIYWGVGLIAPTAQPWKRALGALAVCWVVELTQLYHTRFLDAWRGTTIGHLVLGTDFDPRDLAAYAFGTFGALLMELISVRLRVTSRASRQTP